MTEQSKATQPATATEWNYADVWELVAQARPGATATVHCGDLATWGAFDAAADGVSRWLADLRLGPQAVVAICMRNRPEYLQSIFACFKCSLVPANSNFRYTAEELLALWTQADAQVVIYDDLSAPAVESLIDRPGSVRAWLKVPIGGQPAPGSADRRICSWPVVAGRGAAGRNFGAGSRSGDDIYLLFTGGTTGLPKGVRWRQDDLFALLNRTTRQPYDPAGGLEGVAAALPTQIGPRLLAAAPMMHGLGSLTAMSALSSGGSVVTLGGTSFSPTEFLDAAAAEHVTQASIVGDAFARPILDHLASDPHSWALEDLRLVLSSGTYWSSASKQAISRLLPKVRCVDVLGATEAIEVARAVTTGGDRPPAAGRFELGADTQVLDRSGRAVLPGSRVVGRLAVRGRGPLGYLGDDEATGRTFVELCGARWTVLGDCATVDADGAVRVLGRGDSVINSGGEKVFADEVEAVLRGDPAVADAAVVGVHHELLGEQVVALIEVQPGNRLNEPELRRRVRHELAGFKVPRSVFQVDAVGRTQAGKLDRAALVTLASRLVRGAAHLHAPVEKVRKTRGDESYADR